MENMLHCISEANGIKTFYFPIYCQSPFPINYIDSDLATLNDFQRIVSLESKLLIKPQFRISKISRKRKEVVGLFSSVTLKDGRRAHLRHLDIDAHYEVKEDMEIIEDVLENMYPNRSNPFGGHVVFSGRGYHFYGNDLMTQEEWRKWIERAKENENVDKNWCDIQLKRGVSVLRLTSSELKGIEPKVFYKTNIEI